MATHKICVNELTTSSVPYTHSVTCTSPRHTPVAIGSDADVSLYYVTLDGTSNPPTISFSYDVNMQYQWLDQGVTMNDYCYVPSLSGSVSLGLGTKTCCGSPSISYSAVVSNMNTTPTYVAGTVNAAFTIDNICYETSFKVDDVP